MSQTSESFAIAFCQNQPQHQPKYLQEDGWLDGQRKRKGRVLYGGLRTFPICNRVAKHVRSIRTNEGALLQWRAAFPAAQ